jgi:hypothetical protein
MRLVIRSNRKRILGIFSHARMVKKGIFGCGLD